MGTWGVGAFDNDHACDFAIDIVEGGGLALVRAAIRAVLDVGMADLDASLAEEALVAGEVLARGLGRFGQRNAHTEDLDRWIAGQREKPTAALLSEAVRAMDRVLAPPSELLELWQDSDQLDAWMRGVSELRDRLRGSP